MKTLNGIIGVLLLTVFAACGPTLRPFTQELYEEYGWTDAELQKIQFYLSRDIVLHRQVSTGTTEIISGEIKIVDGKEVEEIIIREGTPGVFMFSPKSNRLAVSFDDGSDERFLMFGPNPKQNNRFVLLGSEWDRRSGKVSYEGQTYWVDADVAYASLMVDLKKISKTKVKSHTAAGRRID
ncbi:MAG: hypothetical protein KDC34_06730 [Saprospiraceae bacterium]|nr:hypothetical protein [Saprospiraceae bacterium]